MHLDIRGFSLIEILIALSIFAILMSVGNLAFRDKALDRELLVAADTLISKLELAKTNAISGKDAQNYGIKFDSNSYAYFVGSSYITTNEGNEVTSVPSKLEIISNIPENSNQIIFSRITGDSNYSSDITVTIREIKDHENKIDIIIGNLGEISMIK